MDVRYKRNILPRIPEKRYNNLQPTPPGLQTPFVSPPPVKGIGGSLYMHFVPTGTTLQILKQPVPRRLPSVVSFFASCLISFGSSPASRQTSRPPVLGCVLH